MFILAFYLAAPANQPVLTATDLGWRRYYNERYGYSTCYPSRLMTAGREADARDGRSFRSNSGAELRVWASYVLEDEDSVSSRAFDMRNEIKAAGGIVTYDRSRPGWTVVSGRSARKKLLDEDRTARRSHSCLSAEIPYQSSKAIRSCRNRA